MSLSANAKPEINTYEVLLDIAGSLSVLVDQKSLKAKIDQLYSLTAEGEKRLQEAKDTIAKSDTIRKENIKLSADLSDREKTVTLREASATKLESKLADLDTALAAKQKELKNITDSQAIERKTIDDQTSLNASNIKKLQDRTASLDEREAKIAAQEASLQNKAKQLKELAGGL